MSWTASKVPYHIKHKLPLYILHKSINDDIDPNYVGVSKKELIARIESVYNLKWRQLYNFGYRIRKVKLTLVKR